MRQVVRNTFVKGMNQDNAYAVTSSDSFFFGLNGRLTTDSMGLSSMSFGSIKGNKKDYSLPDVGDSWTITINDTFVATNLDGQPRTFELSIKGISKQISFRTTEIKVFFEIVTDFINSGAYGGTVPVKAQNSSNELVIFTDDYSLLQFVTSTTPGVVIAVASPGGTDLEVVGSVSLRDSIVLFTTPKAKNGSGQIWEVTWDSSDVPSLRLVRNMQDGFSTSLPIEAVSRYETDSIRRIYWTDNANPIRSLNIDSDSAYIDTINIVPAVEFDIPIPIEIVQSGGDLPTGIYSASYRLKSLGGSTTAYSRFSPPLKIQKANEETSPYREYKGSPVGVVTSKAIKFRIDNIDSSFSNIDIVVAKYNTTGIPTYYKIEENFSLLGVSTYEFTLSTLDATKVIAEAEVLLNPAAFLRAKTLSIKDNRLLAANVKDSDLSLDSWDSTAIRYTNAGTTDGYENTTNKTNKYNKDSTRSPISTSQQKYQAGGSSVLGGIGDNVSFKFITQDLVLDSIGGTTDTQPSTHAPIRYSAPSGQPDIILNGKTLPMGGYWKNYKNPFLDAWIKGYTRSEVYRFGVVFFDLKGRPSAVKWISDIRMPEAGEVPYFTQTATELKGHALGMQFTIKVTGDMKTKFTGFSIVRAERTDTNKTIVASGIVGDLTTVETSSDGTVGYPGPFPDASFKIFLRADRLISYGSLGIHSLYKQIDVPFWKFNKQPLLEGMKLRPIVSVVPTTFGLLNATDSGVPTTGDYGIYARFYGVAAGGYYTDNNATDNIVTLSREIDKAMFMPSRDSRFTGTLLENVPIGQAGPRTDNMFSDTAGYEGFFNYSAIRDQGPIENTAGAGTNQITFRSRGSSTTIVKCKQSMYNTYTTGARVLSTSDISSISSGSWIGGPPLKESSNLPILISFASTFGKRLITNFYKELENQYGGDSLSAIAETSYISTGHYQSFRKQDAGNTYTVTVFGGDTYINSYNETTGMANHDTGIAQTLYNPGDDNARMSSLFFPLESTINIDIRQSQYFSLLGVGEPAGANNSINFFYPVNDTFNYDSINYRQQDNIKFKALSAFRNNTFEFDNRIHASEVKINGEPGDSWTSFAPLTFKDVDGNHGPINKLITFNDQVLFFQDSAFGLMSINPRTSVQGSDGVSLELGKGGILHDYNYYSTTIGSKHQWSVFQSPHAVYWFNFLNKKIYRYHGSKPEEMGTMKGMHSFLVDNIDETLENIDNPLNKTGMHGSYDFLNQEAVFTFLGQSKTKPDFTFAYSETSASWTSFYSFLPKHYINSTNRFLSPNPEKGNDIYRHNKGEYLQFYEKYYNFDLSIIVNPHANETKMFENISFHTNVRNLGRFSLDQYTFNSFSCHTDYQHSGPISLIPNNNIKRREREWSFVVPRNVMKETGTELDLFDANNYDTSKVYKDKMRDKYMVQHYSVPGKEKADQLLVNYINTYYRVSAR